MKILQLCNKVPFPPKDGGAIAILNLAKGLVDKGHTVDILAMATLKHPAKKTEELHCDGMMLDCVFVDTNIKTSALIKNLLFSKTPYNAERFIDKNYSDKLIEKLTSDTYDVVQLEGAYLLPYLPLIRKHSSAKISLRSHNIENEIWYRLYSNETSFFKKFYYKILARRVEKFERRYINKYDFLVPITYRDAVVYQRYGNKQPSKVIQTGIQKDKIANSLTVREKRKMYFIGSLDWLPNQEGVLWFIDNVWPMISHHSAHLEFNIAGRNAPDWFAKRVTRPGIVFHGEVEDARVFADENDIMIVPLLSGGGMRVKIVEAMSLGKIVVTTPIGAEGLDIIPNYHSIVAETPDDFATGVEVLLENTDFFIKLGNNSIRFIRNNYTNMVLAKDLAEFYQANL